MITSLLQKADRFPPCLCRFVARKNHGMDPMSHREIGRKARMSKDTVASLSLKTSWKGVPVDVIDRFSWACGVDIMNPKNAVRFLRKGKKRHLTVMTPQQRRFMARVINSSVNGRK